MKDRRVSTAPYFGEERRQLMKAEAIAEQALTLYLRPACSRAASTAYANLLYKSMRQAAHLATLADPDTYGPDPRTS